MVQNGSKSSGSLAGSREDGYDTSTTVFVLLVKILMSANCRVSKARWLILAHAKPQAQELKF